MVWRTMSSNWLSRFSFSALSCAIRALRSSLESFFEEEIRCGFLVDKNRKKLWGILLDILSEFNRVCQDNKLSYFLCDGTLLGAVRHKGMIPWDDDIDVAMPRKDYDKLLELSHKFRSPYLLQSPTSDKGYCLSFAKVRNINTTFAAESLMYNDFNQGCFIDIFPLDFINIDNIDSCDTLFNHIKLLARCIGVALRRANPNFINNDIEIENILKEKTLNVLYNEIQSLAKSAGSSEDLYLASLVSTITHYRKKAMPISCTKETILLPFENLTLPVPIGYEEILTRLYGDYKQFPPENQRGSWHQGFIIDPDVPYDLFKKQYFHKNE